MVLDVPHDFAREVALGSEDAARDQVTLDLGEPVFDLVQPRRIGGREVQMDFGMIGEELLNPTRLVGREIVENDVDLFASALAGDDCPQEGYEVLAGVAFHGFPKDLSGPRVESREERQGAVAVVLEPMPFEAAGAQGQNGVKAIQGLDVGLLVNAKHRRMLRRIEVEANHVGRLRLEVRIVGQHVAADALGLDSRPRPNPVHQHVAHTEVLRKLARRPVRRSIRGLAAGSGKDATLHCGNQHLSCLTQMSRVQTRQRAFQKTLLPTRHVGGAATQSIDDRVKCLPVGQHQNQPRFPGVICAAAARANSQLKRFANRSCEDHLRLGEHAT